MTPKNCVVDKGRSVQFNYQLFHKRSGMIDSQRGVCAEMAVTISSPTSASGMIVLSKTDNQEILIDVADFAL